MAINPLLIKSYTEIRILLVKIEQLGIQDLLFNYLATLSSLLKFPDAHLFASGSPVVICLINIFLSRVLNGWALNYLW